MVASKGRTPCGNDCPYYEPSGLVRCIGGTKQTHCRLLMQPYWLDCNAFDVRTLRRMEVSDEEFNQMLLAVGKQPLRVRKPWKTLHKETNHVGKKKK